MCVYVLKGAADVSKTRPPPSASNTRWAAGKVAPVVAAGRSGSARSGKGVCRGGRGCCRGGAKGIASRRLRWACKWICCCGRV